MKKPAKRILSLAAATSLVAASTTGLAYADIENYYLKDTANDVVYEYSFQDLLNSLNGDGVLFSNFGEKSQSLTMYSVYDSVSDKYIDFEDLVEAYNAGVEDLNEFTSAYEGENIEMPGTVKAVTVDGGAIVETDKEITVGLTVVSASAIDATTIEVTFSNDETVQVTLDTPLVDGSNEVTFTYNEVEYTVTVEWEAPAELAVESVSAVNGTTIEVTLSRALEEGETLTYTVAGTAYTATYDGAVATLTVPQMVDETAYAVVVNDGAADLYSADVTYDKNEITSISTTSTTVNATVGENVSVVYTVEDEDEDAVEGTSVRVRATNGAGDIVKEEVLTTDSEGKVTFTYTAIDPSNDTISAVALDRPVVRNNDVTVEWTIATGQIQVVNPENAGAVVGLTEVKYVATFLDEDGNPLDDGETVYVNLAGATHANMATAGDDEFISNQVDTVLYSATLDNGDGTAVLEFTVNTAAAEITPTFYYAGSDSIADLTSFDETHARKQAQKVDVLDGTTQEPTFTLALKDGDGVNSDVTEVNGEYNVVDTSDITFVLTAEDQYGNPFIGTANLDNKVDLDSLAGNDNLPGNIQFAADEEDGSTFTPAVSADFTSLDTDQDGVIEVKVDQTGSSVGDTTNLVVWVDVDGDGKYDAGEGVESAKITFVEAETPVVDSMNIEADETAIVADGATNVVTYTVNLLDAAGEEFDATTNQDVIVKLYKDGELIDQDTDSSAVVQNETSGSGSLGDDYVITGISATDGEFDFEVLPAATDAGSEIYPVVYIDLNNDGIVQDDETVSVQGPAFTAVAEPDSYEVELSETDLTAGDSLDIEITALQSDGTTVETNFDGEFVVEVLLADDTDPLNTTVSKTYLRTANFVDGVATITVPVELVGTDDVLVTMPVGTTASAEAGAANDDDLTITAAEATELTVNASNELLVSDAYGNTADYDFTGIATITTDGTFSGTLDAENKMQIKIVDGVVTDTSDVALTLTGSADDTLTIELTNGDSFSITLE